MKAIILAAGAGTRMKSHLPKCLHEIMGRSMVETVIQTAFDAGSDEVIVVTGYDGQLIRDSLRGSKNTLTFVEQKELLGTGHAVLMAKDQIQPKDTVLVLYGDTPLVTPDAITRLVNQHNKEKNAVTVLSTIIDDAFGYGRIIHTNADFLKIIEQRDLQPDQLEIKEINTGIYLFQGQALLDSLPFLRDNNAAGEYYLTDAPEIIQTNGLKAGVYCEPCSEQFMGVNNRVQLAKATEILKRRVNEQFMMAGVTMLDPTSVWIGHEVEIGVDTLIYPGVILEGKTSIGTGCVIGPQTRITDSEIEKDAEVTYSVLDNATVGAASTVGPFAYLRPHTVVGPKCKIGCFVDVKNASLGEGTKAAHLTYVGDADVGKNVNFGCGTVTCNYDGHRKFRTIIEDNAFIGCNTNLVAPVTVGEGAYTAAGSTVTEDAPPGSLVIARARQVNKRQWHKK